MKVVNADSTSVMRAIYDRDDEDTKMQLTLMCEAGGRCPNFSAWSEMD